MQGGRGHCTVYYTSPQSFMITFSFWLAEQLWGLLMNLIGCFIQLNVQMFQLLNVIYSRGNSLYNHWWCASIYRPLSYPFRSLDYPHLKKLTSPFSSWWSHLLSSSDCSCCCRSFAISCFSSSCCCWLRSLAISCFSSSSCAWCRSLAANCCRFLSFSSSLASRD